MSYNLEKIVSARSRIYQQMTQYYNFCEQIRGMSPTTIQSKIYVLNGFIAMSRLTDLRRISNQHVYDWIARQAERGNTGRSINDRLAHLRAMLHWQQNMNLLMPHLQLGLIVKVKEAPARKVSFTRQEIDQVLALVNLEEWLLIKMTFDCGLRIGELRTLRKHNIHGERIVIIGKGNKRRYAYLSVLTRQRLEQWMHDRKIRDYLWPSPLDPTRPMAICTLRQKMKNAFKRANFTDFCPHDLRHSYATDLKLLGIPTRKIQAGLGHASEATTEQYLSDLDGWDLCEIYRQKYAHESIVENSSIFIKNHEQNSLT